MVKESLSKMLGFNYNESKQEQVRDLKIEEIKTNPFQPRKYFDSIQLDELTKSIKEYGVIQPIIVREAGKKFELVAGERRLRASQAAGLKTIPAIVRNLTDLEIAELALIENLQREDLNYFEEAEGYKKLIQDFSLTQEEIARKVGKSQSTIANKIRLLKLPESVKQNITPDIVTERHARALLKLPGEREQIEILKEIYENELNVRETDLLIEKYLQEHQNTNENSNKENRKKIVRIFKDMRLYLNTIRSAVSAIKEAGVNIKAIEKDYEEFIEINIKIPKNLKGNT